MTLSPSSQLREAGSPQPTRRRFGRRLSVSHVLIAVVVILAFVLNLLVLQDRSSTTLVAVADRPLSAGSAVDASALRLVPVDSGFEGLPGLITEDELDALNGWLLARPVGAGALIDDSALIEPGAASGLRSMSLPVPVEHAAGGSVVAGDRVDVISVVEGNARFVAVDLEVIAVAEAASGAIGTVSGYHVVVAVEGEEALALAGSLDRGSIELIRSTGAEAIEGNDDGS